MKQKRVMVVDYNRSRLEMIGHELEQLGYEHVSFTDPNEALAFFKRNHADVDLAIMDMAVSIYPEQMAKEMRVVVRDLLLIIMTTDEILQCAKGITIRFLPKPPERSELIHAIESLIGSRENE